MSGHSKWAQIKHQKAATDAKKGKIFSKISRVITLAAKKGSDPAANLSLKMAISQAKEVNMPADNIGRAIKKGSGELSADSLEEVRYEAFGPGGTAMIIEGITDNKNRTLNDIKHLLSLNGGKLAGQGAVLWSFDRGNSGEWQPKRTVELSGPDMETTKKLIESLENLDDVQNVYTNTSL